MIGAIIESLQGIQGNLVFYIAMAIIFATFLAYISGIFKQPLIPAYLIAGLVLGPFGLKIITQYEDIRLLSEIGIALLLFIVGLELDFKRLKDIGLIASVGGTLKAGLIFVLGLLVVKTMGMFSTKEGVLLGVMLAFSSTMVVVKLLSDKRELDTLHGRIVIGILLMEDILAILVISVLSTGNVSGNVITYIFVSLLKGVLILIGAIVCSKFIFPPIFKFAARSQELLFLVSLSTCFAFALIVAGMGFSIAIGAFMAGVAIANLPYNYEIVGKIKPLRDFFATLFFVSLGLEVVPISFSKYILPIIILVLFVIIIKPILTMTISGLFGYTKRTSFLSAITLSQISEFSLIIMAQAFIMGIVSQEVFTVNVIMLIITVVITSYLIKYDNVLYFKVSKYLGIFEKFPTGRHHLEYSGGDKSYDAILVGYDRIGYSIAKKFSEMRKSMFIVDFNPDIIKKLVKQKVPCLYGDIGDPEILNRLNLKDVEIIISTVPEKRYNLVLIDELKKVNKRATVFVTAGRVEEALELYDKGADYVILPHLLGGDHVSFLLEDITRDISKLIYAKMNHIEELNHRRRLGHDHPKQDN